MEISPITFAGIDAALARQASGLTLGGLLTARARRVPDRIALEAGPLRLTYRQFDDRANRAAHVLLASGVQRGDRFAILSENRAEYVELLVAAAKLGAIAACQNWRLHDTELSHCLDLVSPKHLFTSERHEAAARRLAGNLPLTVFGPAYEAGLAAASPETIADCCDPEDGVVILYTSGTTGMPKGALVSQRAEIARASAQLLDHPTTFDDAFIAWAPLFHMVSTDTVFMTLIEGGKVIVTDGFDAEQLAEIVTREKLGRLTLMPGMITPFLDALKAKGRPPAGVKWAGVMADLVPRRQIAEVTTLLGAPFLNSFGSTETGMPPATRGNIGIGVVPTRLDKVQSALCAIKLVDPEDIEVPDGMPGELAMRGPTLFSGYWNNPKANEVDFRGGWFHMGDVFVRNPDGTLAFVDRRKYLIKSGGENIYPAEIERVLLAEPRVRDAVVIRRADERWGEVPVAFVVRREDSLTTDDLLARCTQQLARFKLPKDIQFVDDAFLPRSTTGKIMRHELEARLALKT